jgi:pyridoxal phosphate enzyme (YggS family)
MSNSADDGELATRLAALQQQVADLGGKAGDGHPPARLIGASKAQPEAVLLAALRLGLREFGENKVQEAAAKWPGLRVRFPDIRLHLIGPLQSNKAREAVALFDVIHTVDRPKIADALAEACAKEGKRPAMLIQVNTGEEPQKAGVSPDALATLVAHCRDLDLPITGLMCVPPADVNPAPHFALLRRLADGHGLSELSMGMSGDYAIALRLGATMVRVGTALFGART